MIVRTASYTIAEPAFVPDLEISHCPNRERVMAVAGVLLGREQTPTQRHTHTDSNTDRDGAQKHEKEQERERRMPVSARFMVS